MTTTSPVPAHRRDHAWLALVVFAAAVVVVAVVGGLAAGSASSTYENLDRPAFAPPSWLFGPAWTVLYVMIALSGWRYWREVGRVDTALVLYGVQLVLNAAWTPIFFAAELYGVALVEILLLEASIVAVAVLFARRDRPAALLLVPYVGWVAYATALTFRDLAPQLSRFASPPRAGLRRVSRRASR